VVALLRGELTEQEARDRTATATRRFARRQDSWFRKDPRIVWLRHDDPQLVEKALSAVDATLGP
jgi:tRNA dimethylallyltransferase